MLASIVLLLLAQSAPAPAAEAPLGEEFELKPRFFKNPREQREEIARNQLFPWLFFGAEAEAEAHFERTGSDRNDEAYLDSISLGVEANWRNLVLARVVEKYDFHDEHDFALDEGLVRVFGTEQVPWFCEAGYTSTPFGEFNSHFKEDPITQVIGETEAWLLTAGYDSDAGGMTLTVFNGKDGSDDFDLVANAQLQFLKDWDVGAYWSSDVSEAGELRQIRKDSPPVPAADYPGSSSIMGAGAFVTCETESYDVDLEALTALESFAPGVLSDRREKPWAADVEAALRPTPRFEFALRAEASHGIPETPHYQFGIGTSYGLCPNATVSLEFLHGITPGEANREQVVVGLVVRY